MFSAVPALFSVSGLASQQINVAEHFVRGLMMQRNVSKGVSVGDGMNRRREKRMKDRPKGSQTGRQKNK